MKTVFHIQLSRSGQRKSEFTLESVLHVNAKSCVKWFNTPSSQPTSRPHQVPNRLYHSRAPNLLIPARFPVPKHLPFILEFSLQSVHCACNVGCACVPIRLRAGACVCVWRYKDWIRMRNEARDRFDRLLLGI